MTVRAHKWIQNTFRTQNQHTKSVTFSYTNYKQSEKENKKTISFAAAPKKNKILGINLIKEMKDLDTENYKIFFKKFMYF